MIRLAGRLDASRRGRWQRLRAQRVVAAALAGGAVFAGWHAFAPPADATRSMTVAAHDLPMGHRLVAADLTQVDWPVAAKLPGSLSPRAAVGRVLTSSVQHGEPVTAGRLRDSRGWAGASSGTVLMAVPVGSPQLASLIRRGDRVDVLARGSGKSLGTAVLVTRVSAPPGHDGSSLLASGASKQASLMVACTTAEAQRIAQALRATAAGGGILLTLHPAA